MDDQGLFKPLTEQADQNLKGMECFFQWPINSVPKKVVSLVPSITDSLIQLGFGHTLVGITDYCPEAGRGSWVERIGGPATINIEKIIQLDPDLVIGGVEENGPLELMNIHIAGLPLWVVFPKTVDETIAFLYQLAEGFRSKVAFHQVRSLEGSITCLRLSGRADSQKRRYFCPIWWEINGNKELWMVFNNQTYAADLLSLFGAENCFGSQGRRAWYSSMPSHDDNPPCRDTRYFNISSEDVLKADPDLILLPSEPYPFDESHQSYVRQHFNGVTAIEQGRIRLIDGKMMFWYGTRLGQASQELPFYFFDNE